MKLFYSDEALLDGLRKRKQSYIEYIYLEFTPLVRYHVHQNSGNASDVDDLVQEAMIILYKRCMSQTFKLECSLKTYFVSICKNLWLQQLARKYRFLYQSDSEVNEPHSTYRSDDPDRLEEEAVKHRLFYKNMLALPKDCQHLLELYFLEIPYKEIARMLKLKDEVFVKTRKYACKNLLRKKIMNDPEFHQYFKL
jgi:RNA polymerase sigma factor (sigma-70 family)